MLNTVGGPPQTKYANCAFNCIIRYFALQGMPYSPVKLTGASNAQCLQGVPYSPVKFTGAPDAQCLQGMLYSQVRFTKAPDAQCLLGMPYYR